MRINTEDFSNITYLNLIEMPDEATDVVLPATVHIAHQSHAWDRDQAQVTLHGKD